MWSRPFLHQAQEDRRGFIDYSKLGVGQCPEALGKIGIAASTALLQDSLASIGDMNPDQPAVVWVRFFRDEVLVQKIAGHHRHAGSRDPLCLRPFTERERTARVQ